MAGFGGSCQDILLAISIAKTISETWFDKHKRADSQYLQFGKDVGQFGGLLEQFSTVFESASAAQANRLSLVDFQRWQERTNTQREEVVGSFTETLDECKQLLARNEKYLKKKANFWENARWHLAGAGDHAERLRSKLQFHTAKIDLLISFDINANITALREEIQSLPGVIQQPFARGLPPVPRELADLYKEALTRDAPNSFSVGGVENFPLSEGLDALISAFNQSTVKINRSATALRIWGPKVEDINNLLKARFIFDCMVNSRRLLNAGPESPWAWALVNVLTKLQAEYRNWQQDLDSSIASVASLNPESFQIWVVPETSAIRLATEPDETQGEEKILEVPLAGSTDHVSKTLFVFRRPSNELRVLTFLSANQISGGGISSYDDFGKIVNLHRVEVVPRYALPAQVRTPLRMELCFPGASSGYTYQFMTRDDLKMFQQAALGYKINFEEFCQWTFHTSSILPPRRDEVKGQGFVQLLQPKPLPAIKTLITDSNAAHIPAHGLSRVRTDSTVTSPGALEPPTRRLSRASTLCVQESKKSTLAAHPPSPVLLILTEVDGQPTFLHLRLTPNICIKKKRCDCNDDKPAKRDACPYTVLEASSGKMSLRRLSVPTQNPTAWNLALLGLKHPGFLQHPEFDSKLKEVENVKWLSIQMNPEGRSELQTALETAFKIRNKQMAEYNGAERQARHAAERPKARLSTANLSSRSLRSPSIAQSDFSRRISTPSSLHSTASSASVSPLRMPSLLESNTALAPLQGNLEKEGNVDPRGRTPQER